LAPGDWRELTLDEVRALSGAVEDIDVDTIES